MVTISPGQLPQLTLLSGGSSATGKEKGVRWQQLQPGEAAGATKGDGLKCSSVPVRGINEFT